LGRVGYLRAFDEALINANVNEDVTVDVPPEKAFGSRDPNKVRLIPLRKLGDKADEAKVGDVIEMDNRVGIIRSISSGRVQIDFNHRLAGKTITYSFKVVKVLENDRERVVALIRRRMPVKQDKLNVVINNDGMLDIFIPEEYYMQEGLQIVKRGIANDIFKYVKSIKSIRFIEVYERKEDAKESKVEEKRAAVEEEVKQEEQAQVSTSTGNT
jgi:FKBP-type peptidyl-prolyl cis-trans isomerases 2